MLKDDFAKVALVHHCEATSCSMFTKPAGTTLIGPIALQPLPPLNKHILLALYEMDPGPVCSSGLMLATLTSLLTEVISPRLDFELSSMVGNFPS